MIDSLINIKGIRYKTLLFLKKLHSCKTNITVAPFSPYNVSFLFQSNMVSLDLPKNVYKFNVLICTISLMLCLRELECRSFATSCGKKFKNSFSLMSFEH